MGPFRDLLNSAKRNNSEAVTELYKKCQPTIKKYSYFGSLSETIPGRKT